MNILWFTWKDKSHPLAGGAETVSHEIAKRLVRDGHSVMFVVGGYDGCIPEEKTVDGYRVVRLGNRYSVYWHAFRYYRKNLEGWADIVVDESNAIPFFASWYVSAPNVLFIHHVTGSGWLYQISFPFNIIGYFFEPLVFLLMSRTPTITISQSTKDELVRLFFPEANISIIPEGIDCAPIASLSETDKYTNPTLLFVGGIRPLKRPIDVIHAFEIAKKKIPDLKLKIAGTMDDGGTGYGKKFLDAVHLSDSASSIEYLGKVSFNDRQTLMRRSHLIAVTSMKEGWGLIVTEANSQGTPAIVYNVPGLRDSTLNDKTGVVCKENTPQSLADEIVALHLDSKRYTRLQEAAWQWSKEFSFEKTYQEFLKRIILIVRK